MPETKEEFIWPQTDSPWELEWTLDQLVFRKEVLHKQDTICVIYVDDTLFFSKDDSIIGNTIQDLKDLDFGLTDKGGVNAFLGVKVEQSTKNLCLQHVKLIQSSTIMLIITIKPTMIVCYNKKFHFINCMIPHKNSFQCFIESFFIVLVNACYNSYASSYWLDGVIWLYKLMSSYANHKYAQTYDLSCVLVTHECQCLNSTNSKLIKLIFTAPHLIYQSIHHDLVLQMHFSWSPPRLIQPIKFTIEFP